MKKKFFIYFIMLILLSSLATASISNLSINPSASSCSVPIGANDRGQSFKTFDNSYNFVKAVYVWVETKTGSSASLNMVVAPETGGKPDISNALANITIDDASISTTAYNKFEFDAGSYPELTAGNLYFIDLSSAGGVNDYKSCYDADSYANGTDGYVAFANRLNPASWTLSTLDYKMIIEFSTTNGGAGPSVGGNFTVYGRNIFGNTSVENFTVKVNNTEYVASSGFAITNISNLSQYVGNVEIYSAQDDNGPFFNVTYSNHNTSHDLNGYLIQTEPTFHTFKAFSNESIQGSIYNDTYFLNYTGNRSYFKSGTNNIIFDNGIYNNTLSVTLPDYFNASYNVEGVYDSLLNITVKNNYTNENLTNFSGYIYYPGNGYNYSFNTTNGSILIGITQGLNYTVYAEAPNYGVSLGTNYLNLSADQDTENLTFGLYSSNSVLVTVRDIEDNSLMTENISLTVTGDTETKYYFTGGSYLITNLTDSNYTFKVQDVNENYSLSTYLVTVADNSFQNLNVYLTENAGQTVFTVTNSLNSQAVEGATFTQSKLIGGSYTLVESKSTDITGKAQFSYLSSSKYKFTISKSGYTSKVFYLDPILFSTYSVQLDPEIASDIEPQYSHVEIEFYPVEFYNNQNNSVTVLFSSYDGSLSNYYINLTYKDQEVYFNDTNAYGSEDELYLYITGATIYDVVNISYGYDTVLGKAYHFNINYPIINVTGGNHTIVNNKFDDYGLGWFERVSIAVLITLIVAGLIGFLAGYTPGLAGGLLLFGYFTYINFIPLWGLLLAVFVGIILLTARPGASL